MDPGSCHGTEGAYGPGLARRTAHAGGKDAATPLEHKDWRCLELASQHSAHYPPRTALSDAGAPGVQMQSPELCCHWEGGLDMGRELGMA